MLKQLCVVLFLLLSSTHVLADEPVFGDDPIRDNVFDPDRTILALDIIHTLTEGKTPDEIRDMIREIAEALSDASLCGPESVEAMYRYGIPYGRALDAIARACRLTGPQIAALAGNLAPGLHGHGGPEGDASSE